MKSIKIQNLSYSIENKPILDNVSLEVQSGEFFFLLGPSGCGKTSLLRQIAGFAQPSTGEIYFGETLMNPVPPQDRNIGMVFQSYALFPHMTVMENIEYGLKIRNMSASERQGKVRNALEVVNLTGYETRLPGSLSGGEQQRVALARALVIEPDLLLLDEPLSNLDAQLRIQMRQELRQIQKSSKVTTIYVTHDQDEALSMADRISVMKQGSILQTGTPQEIYYNPKNSFIAGFIGEANIITGKIMEKTGTSQVAIQTAFGQLMADSRNKSYTPHSPATCCFRPESVEILDSPDSASPNNYQGTVTDCQFRGDSLYLVIHLPPSNTIHAILHHPHQTNIKAGQQVNVYIPPQNIQLLNY